MLLLVLALLWLPLCLCKPHTREDYWVTVPGKNGATLYLADNRKPALYTENFGSCMENSPLNLSSFDASFFRDNMTLTFQFAGTTTLDHEDLMISLAIFAYGERRVAMHFNPCDANMYSLCPPEANKSVFVNGLIPLSQADTAIIPPIALTIPDFEGEAIIQIFSNVTRAQIGCYSSAVTNGYSMARPHVVNSILILFVAAAMFSSILTVFMDDDLTVSRSHYAHSPSVLVTVSVLHHIFYTGAISVNWPRILIAFWSNFSWLAGMIHTDSMQNALTSSNEVRSQDLLKINSTPAGYTTTIPGAFASHEIYGPDPPPGNAKRQVDEEFELHSESIDKGFPLPGSYSGFPGVLSVENISASNAFFTGLIWFVICMVVIGGSCLIFKASLEFLTWAGAMRQDRFSRFRKNWTRFTAVLLGRMILCGYFMLTFLSIYQFALGGKPGTLLAAAIVFIFIVGGTLAASHRTILSTFEESEGSDICELSLRDKILFLASNSWSKVRELGEEGQEVPSLHKDTSYIRKFGWLFARFREERWWAFVPWLAYEFVRSCILGGGISNPMGQIVASLIWEVLAFALFAWMKPFEAVRLNVLAVYLLSTSKVLTLCLTMAFHPRFHVQRIMTTIIGVVIIIIQGILALITVVYILIGAVCTHLSLRRRAREGQDVDGPVDKVAEGYLSMKYLNRIDPSMKSISETPALSSDLGDTTLAGRSETGLFSERTSRPSGQTPRRSDQTTRAERERQPPSDRGIC